MTLPEMLSRTSDKSREGFVLTVLYYQSEYKGEPYATTSKLKSVLVEARVPKARGINVSDVLAKAGGYVDSTKENGKRAWRLTETGFRHVASMLGSENTQTERDVSRLSKLVASVSDENTRDYIEESLKCLRAGAPRACVVFLWAAAVDLIRKAVYAKGASESTDAVQRFKPDAKPIRSVDDLASINEDTLLLVAKELGIFDKNEKDQLKNYCLDVRNKSGHPGKYRPSFEKASAVIEDLTSMVFTKL